MDTPARGINCQDGPVYNPAEPQGKPLSHVEMCTTVLEYHAHSATTETGFGPQAATDGADGALRDTIETWNNTRLTGLTGRRDLGGGK